MTYCQGNYNTYIDQTADLLFILIKYYYLQHSYNFFNIFVDMQNYERIIVNYSLNIC